MDRTRLNKGGGGLKDLYIQMQREAFFSLKKKRCEKSASYNFEKMVQKDTGCTDHECRAAEYMNANTNWNLDDNISEESDNSSIKSIYKEDNDAHKVLDPTIDRDTGLINISKQRRGGIAIALNEEQKVA